MATYNIVAGTTVPFRFQLLEAGAAINLTGCTVTILVADKNGTVVSSPGTVTVVSASDGSVQLDPTSETTFTAANGPYSIRWKVVDGSSDIYYVPSGSRDIWIVVGA